MSMRSQVLKRESITSVRADVPARSDLMYALLGSVISFMERAGMTESEIRKTFRRCISSAGIDRADHGASSDGSVAYGCDTIAGAVLRAWHKFPKYLDDSARPVHLKANGFEPTLTSLILSQDKRADAKAVIQSMLSAGLISKRGSAYFPEKESATIDSSDPLAVDHIAKTVMRLVETASRNITKSDAKLKLIERYAHVPDLAKSEAKAFAAFSRQQGQACLDAIEDWLEARQIKQASKVADGQSGVNAGVHIFAYIGEGVAARKRVSKGGTNKRSTPAREARV